MEVYLVINKLRKTHNQMLWAARFNIYAGFKYSIGLNQLMQMQNEYIIITAKLKKEMKMKIIVRTIKTIFIKK